MRSVKSNTPKTIYSFGYSFGLYIFLLVAAWNAGRKRGLSASMEAVCKERDAPRGQPFAPPKNEPHYSFFAADFVARGDLLSLSFHLVSGDFVA